MKLTKTLRTIAFSGLGLLAGASTLYSSQDARDFSLSGSGTNLVDTQMTLRTWAQSPRTGVSKFRLNAESGLNIVATCK